MYKVFKNLGEKIFKVQTARLIVFCNNLKKNKNKKFKERVYLVSTTVTIYGVKNLLLIF